MTTPADRHDQTRLALSILTAWVTEGADFAIRYGTREMADENGIVTTDAVAGMIDGHARLSAVLLHTLAEVTGRDPLDVLRVAAEELAA